MSLTAQKKLPSYEMVVAMNFEGVLLMKEQRNVEAIEWFHRGLEVIKTIEYHRENINDTNICSKTKTSSNCCEHVDNSNNSDHTVSYRTMVDELDRREEQQKCDRMPFSVALPEQQEKNVSDDIFILFNRALQLPLDILDDQLLNSSNLLGYLLSSVLIYNIGLACHLVGLRKGCSKILLEAHTYYSMAYKTMMNKRSDLKENSYLVRLGLLAVANNIGHIYAHFRCLKEAASCRDEISLHLLDPSFSKYVPIDFASRDDDEYNTFIMNVCFFPGVDIVPAPAA